MAGRRSYTAEEKAAALELYVELGPGETHRRTGIPKGTLESWAHREGLHAPAPEQTAEATARYKAISDERRAAVEARLWEIAELGTEVSLGMLPEACLRDVVGAWTRAIHDAKLLAGEATERPDLGLRNQVETEAEDRALRLVS